MTLSFLKSKRRLNVAETVGWKRLKKRNMRSDETQHHSGAQQTSTDCTHRLIETGSFCHGSGNARPKLKLKYVCIRHRHAKISKYIYIYDINSF